MSEENMRTAQRILDAWATGDFEAGLPDLAPNAVLVTPPELGEWGVFVGEDQMRDYILRFTDQFDKTTIEATGFREAGDTVLASVTQRGTGRTSGIDLAAKYFFLITFRGGKIVRMESFREEADALEAAGLSE